MLISGTQFSNSSGVQRRPAVRRENNDGTPRSTVTSFHPDSAGLTLQVADDPPELFNSFVEALLWCKMKGW